MSTTDTDWRSYAQCADLPMSEVEFYFFDQANYSAAKVLFCNQCLVRKQCLTEAMKLGSVGLAGGLTETDRRDLAKLESILPKGVLPENQAHLRYLKAAAEADALIVLIQ